MLKNKKNDLGMGLRASGALVVGKIEKWKKGLLSV